MKNHILNRSEGKNSTTGWAQPVGLIAFDADDTLWDNQGHFEAVEKAYCRLLSPYGTAEQVSAALFETETANMPLLGYGCKAFTLDRSRHKDCSKWSSSANRCSPCPQRRCPELWTR